MEMHSVANLATLQTPLATPPLQKKALSDKSLGFVHTLFSFWDSLVLLREVLLSQRAHAPTCLSLCVSALFNEQRFQLNTDIMLLL